ncbi:MAG: protein kinase domain-containing protein, partial [Candidatus Xenobia bacterium]
IPHLLHHGRMLSELKHSNLMAAHDMFQEDGRLFLPIDYVEGESLATLLRRMVRTEDFLPLPQIVAWGDIVCDVLQYLHDLSPPVVYGAVKPANLLLDNTARLWVADADAKRLLHRERVGTTIPLTPGFAPIEQYSKETELDPRMDLYALGATLYQLITKEVPTSAVDRMMGSELKPPSEKNKNCPPELDAVILRMMALQREDRFDTVAEARAALKAAYAPASQPLPAIRCRGLDIGSTLEGRYVVESIVEVDVRWALYLGYDNQNASRTLAIYEMLDGNADHARLHSAALNAADAPEITPVSDVIEEGGAVYLISDWADGVSLSDLVAGLEGFVPVEVALHVLEQMCELLHHLYDRETPAPLEQLTPAYVMVKEDGTIALTGFPMGRVQEGEAAQHFQAPSISPFLADMYALGAVMYNVLTRRVPPTFEARTLGGVELESPQEINPEVPGALNDLVLRLLSLEDEERPQDPNELWERVRIMIATLSIKPQVPSDTMEPQASEGDPFYPIEQQMRLHGPGRQAARVTATVWWPEDKGLRGLLKGKQVEEEQEEVEVVDLSVDALTIVSDRQRKPGLALRVKMGIPRRGRPAARLDVRTVIESAEPHLGRWRYNLDLRSLPAQLRDILASAGPDRRRAPRFRCCFKVISSDFADTRAVVEELSATGCLLTTVHSFAPNTALTLALQVEQSRVTIRVQGRVIHCDPPTDGRYRIGLCFEAITQPGAATLQRFIENAARAVDA